MIPLYIRDVLPEVQMIHWLGSSRPWVIPEFNTFSWIIYFRVIFLVLTHIWNIQKGYRLGVGWFSGNDSLWNSVLNIFFTHLYPIFFLNIARFSGWVFSYISYLTRREERLCSGNLVQSGAYYSARKFFDAHDYIERATRDAATTVLSLVFLCFK